MRHEAADPIRTMAAAVPVTAVLLLLMGAGEPGSSCASITDAAERLACYDAQAAAPAEPATTPEPGAGAAPEAPASATPPATGAENRKNEDAEFGLPQTHAESMTTHIVGKFTEWGPSTPVRLANGQLWRVMEDRRYFYPKVPENPEVVITKGRFGYNMEIKALGRRIKVRRVY